MNINRILIITASVFALTLAASGCVFSPSQEEVGLKKMQMQVQSPDSEDADADIDADLDAKDMDADEDAEIAKAAVAGDSVSRITPPLEIMSPIRPIGGRENIPISIGDITIIVQGSLDATAVIGESYSEQFTASASGDDDMFFAWTVTGLPAGLTYSVNGTYSQNLVIEGATTAAGTYPITVKAAQWADPTNFEEYSYSLVVSGDEEEEEEEEDPCSVPLEVKLIDMGDWYICPDDYTGDVNCYDPATDVLPATLGADLPMKFQVFGGKGPFTWTIQSKVEDSYHCHIWMPMLSSPYSEKFVAMIIGPENDEACPAAAKMFSEWTGNATWKPLDGVERPKDEECQETPPTSPEPEKMIVDTEGRTFRLDGGLIYDGPLPVSGSSNTKPQEILSVKVKDSCTQQSPPLQLTFGLDYPSDSSKKIDVEVDYRSLNTYGSEPSMHIWLYEGDEGIGSEKISLEGEPKCSDDDCELDGKIDWEDDQFGVKDITDVKVSLGLGWSNCSQPFNPFAGCWHSSCDCSEYGDMDIRDIKLETDYWKLSYDDQDEGDNQIKKNNHSSDYNITNKPGVKFKRRAFPSSFEDKWKDWKPENY